MTESLEGCDAPQVSTVTEPAPCEVHRNHTSRLWFAWQAELGALFAPTGVAKRVSASVVVLPAGSTVALTHSSFAGGGMAKLADKVNEMPTPLSEMRILTVWFAASGTDSADAGPEHGVPVASSLQAISLPPQELNTEMTVSVPLVQVLRLRMPASGPAVNVYHTSLPVASQLDEPSLVAAEVLPLCDATRLAALAQSSFGGGPPMRDSSLYWLPHGEIAMPPKVLAESGDCSGMMRTAYQLPAVTVEFSVTVPQRCPMADWTSSVFVLHVPVPDS